MTENTNLTLDETKTLLDEKCTEVLELEARIDELQSQVETLQADKKRADIEARLAIEDAELARNFSRKNYRDLIQELIEEPLQRFRRSAYTMLMLVVAVSIGIMVFTVFFSAPANNIANTTTLTHSSAAIKEENTPEPVIDTPSQAVNNDSQQIPQEDSIDKTEAEETTEVEETVKEKQTNQTETKIAGDNIATKETPIQSKPINVADSEKTNTVKRQSSAIVNFVRQAEANGNVPQGYQSDKNKLIQLYLSSMQRALKEPVFYQSYIAAFEALTINKKIQLTKAELINIDSDFLRANYSGYLITLLKKNRKWRYRNLDRRFSTYYDASAGYSLESWQIVNPPADYSKLPYIFAVSLKHVFNQLNFNQQKSMLILPDNIFYTAYPERRKNQAVSILLSGAAIENQNGVLHINTSRLPLTLTNSAIYYVQKALAEKGFMDINIINGKLGPKTNGAISKFRKSNQLEENSHIDLEFLSKLGVIITYKDLLFETPPNV